MLDSANEAIDKEHLASAVVDLAERVDDWKALKVETFGELLRFGTFSVLKSDTGKDTEREVCTLFVADPSNGHGWSEDVLRPLDFGYELALELSDSDTSAVCSPSSSEEHESSEDDFNREDTLVLEDSTSSQSSRLSRTSHSRVEPIQPVEPIEPVKPVKPVERVPSKPTGLARFLKRSSSFKNAPIEWRFGDCSYSYY